MIYLTGDIHGDPTQVELFCSKMQLTENDTIVMLGDVGVNYYGGKRDSLPKRILSSLPVTFLCIHGNHEIRPQNIPEYKPTIWNGGRVLVDEEHPNILFAEDGEIYDLDGKKALAIGGAYSVDKFYRITRGYGWWADEQPSKEIKERVEKKLESMDWNVDVVLTHTVPIKYEPVEVFFPGIDQSKVDKSTERWLGSIENQLQYKWWYAGHYHTSKTIDHLSIMFEDYLSLSDLSSMV